MIAGHIRWATEKKSRDHPSLDQPAVQALLAEAARASPASRRSRCFLKLGFWITEPVRRQQLRSHCSRP